MVCKKRNKHECLVGRDNSFLGDHCLASLGSTLGCNTVAFGTECSICISHPSKIHILYYFVMVFFEGYFNGQKLNYLMYKHQNLIPPKMLLG